MATAAASPATAMSHTHLAKLQPLHPDRKQLPTNWIAPKKPPYRDSILDHSDVKKTLLAHKAQPHLGRNDKEKIKNSFKKQTCIDMLRQGFHKSFREVNNIFKLQIDDRHRLGSEHPVWDRPLLDQEPHKLQYLCTKLNNAESDESQQKYQDIYASYYDLAHYFLLSDDSWLSDYFFEKCLEISTTYKLELQSLAEAYCNLGLAYERRTSYYKAMQNFQEFYKLTKENKELMKNNKYRDLSDDDVARLDKINRTAVDDYLKDLNDDRLFIHACIHLQRIFAIMANKSSGVPLKEKIEYLTEAMEVSKSSSIGLMEGQSAFLLGNAHEEHGDLDAALKCYANFYELSKREKDLDNLGQASEALSKCYEKMGQVDKSIEFLQTYLKEVSNKTADRQYSRACISLANIYNALGQYEVATNYSRKAFDISRQMNHREAIELNRILCGISKAHKNLSHFNRNIEENSRKSVNNLIRWKYETNGEQLLFANDKNQKQNTSPK